MNAQPPACGSLRLCALQCAVGSHCQAGLQSPPRIHDCTLTFPLHCLPCLQASPAGGGPRLGALQCAVDSYRQEGLQVFTKGLGATMARAFITNAAIFATFELCMNVLP